ncbi:MAG: hypothetical protein V1787_01285 [Candidatus Micrarchaeota archaeon]
MAAEKRDTAWLYLLAIGALVAASAFVYLRYIQLHAVQVNGLMLYSLDPANELKAVLGTGKVILREELFEGNDERNSVVAALGAEIAGTYSRRQRVIFIYGHVADAPENESWVNCVGETDNCKNERIIVRLDPCNCLRIEGGRLYVLFDEKTAKDPQTRTRLSGVVNGVLEAVDREKTGNPAA